MQPQVRKTPLPAGSAVYTGKKPVILLVLDGWGIGPDYEGNAIKLANTPNMDKLWQQYAHTQLGASGVDVGLPEDVDGNSETGHMNIGAGGIVKQSLPRVNEAIADDSIMIIHSNSAVAMLFNQDRFHKLISIVVSVGILKSLLPITGFHSLP